MKSADLYLTLKITIRPRQVWVDSVEQEKGFLETPMPVVFVRQEGFHNAHLRQLTTVLMHSLTSTHFAKNIKNKTLTKINFLMMFDSHSQACKAYLALHNSLTDKATVWFRECHHIVSA